MNNLNLTCLFSVGSVILVQEMNKNMDKLSVIQTKSEVLQWSPLPPRKEKLNFTQKSKDQVSFQSFFCCTPWSLVIAVGKNRLKHGKRVEPHGPAALLPWPRRLINERRPQGRFSHCRTTVEDGISLKFWNSFVF